MKQGNKYFLKWFSGNVILVLAFLFVANKYGETASYCFVDNIILWTGAFFAGLIIVLTIAWNVIWNKVFKEYLEEEQNGRKNN